MVYLVIFLSGFWDNPQYPDHRRPRFQMPLEKADWTLDMTCHMAIQIRKTKLTSFQIPIVLQFGKQER